LKTSYTNIWAAIAARYKGNPVIAGYDLINEPVMPKDRNLPSGPPIDYWTPFASQLIQAIRAVDPASIIIVEPSPWGQAKGFGALTPLPFERIVYSFHFYEPHALTHQGIGAYPEGINYPNAVTTKAWLSQKMEVVRAFARKHGVPIYVGEFSIVRWAPGDSAKQYVSDVIDLLEAEGWNWSYHAFREYEGWDAEIDPSLPRYVKNVRSSTAPTIKVLVEKGFNKNQRIAAE
jgi:aryl-phospho-beta-D-glucosidase BglC (GH1 family)